MYCNRLHGWWSTQSRLVTLLSSIIARRLVGLQTLWWFRLKELSVDKMVAARFMSCFCHAFASVYCCLVVTWRERADLLALVCDVYCDFFTFPFGILGQVWDLIVSIPDPCCLSYYGLTTLNSNNFVVYGQKHKVWVLVFLFRIRWTLWDQNWVDNVKFSVLQKTRIVASNSI